MNVLIGILITLIIGGVLFGLMLLGVHVHNNNYAKYLEYPYYALVLILGVLFILSIIAIGEVEYPIE